MFGNPTKRDKELERLTEEITNLTRQVASLRGERDAGKDVLVLQSERARLQKQISDLQISKDRIDEERARELREVKHQVGLERKRQEFEAKQSMQAVTSARQEAVLEVREENLTRDKDRFDEHVLFMETRFGDEVGYLKEIMTQILQRLPTVTVDLPPAVRKADG